MKILYAPDEAILDAKKERKLSKSIIILLISSVLLLATLVVFYQSTKAPLGDLVKLEFPIAIYAFIVPFLGSLFLGFILVVVLNTLGGNGNYFDGLTTVSYSLLPFSIGIFLSVTINVLPAILNITITDMNIILIKGLVVFSIGIFFTAESVAITYRAIKELFEADMVTAFVGVAVLSVAIMIPLYIVVYSTIFQLMLGLFSMGLPDGGLPGPGG